MPCGVVCNRLLCWNVGLVVVAYRCCNVLTSSGLVCVLVLAFIVFESISLSSSPLLLILPFGGWVAGGTVRM